MLVSFYAQISIITISLLLVVLPFLGLPQSIDRVLTVLFSVLILGISVHALYSGYVRVLQREEKRLLQQKLKEKKGEQKHSELEEEKHHSHSGGDGDDSSRRDYSSLHIIRD